MKATFAFLFLLLFSFKGFSQFETPKRTVNIAPISDKKGIVSPTSSRVINYPSIFDKKDKLIESVSLLKKKEEEGKSVFEKEQFASPAKEYTEKANNMLKTEGYASVVENKDFYFGDYKVYTKIIYIECRDYGAIDGDEVAIWINGQNVIPVIGLESNFKKYTLELKEGLNTIEIEALNTGELYPNTGEFIFYDGNNKLITNQRWALNSGFKAILKISKVTGIQLEEKK